MSGRTKISDPLCFFIQNRPTDTSYTIDIFAAAAEEKNDRQTLSLFDLCM